jgi:hypothetical protein
MRTRSDHPEALVTTSTVVRLERRPGHARSKPTTWQNRGSMSTILIGKYRATIYPEDNGYIGSISLGFDGKGSRQRVKRRGRTKAAVTDKLRKAVEALETGIDASDSYTVADAVRDWLSRGLKGREENTIAANRILAEQHVIPLIGAAKLKELTADDVDAWLDGLTAKLATRACKASTRSSSVPSGRRRPVTRCSATWPNWSPRPKGRREGQARP